MRITQAEARRLKQRVEALDGKLKRFVGSGYPGGVNLWNEKIDPKGVQYATLRTARRLGRALIATLDDDGTIMVYGVEP
jgi:hypothetical protein